MKVVEAEYHAGEYLIGGHGAVAGLVAELPDRAAVALRQQYGPLLFKHRAAHLVLRSCVLKFCGYPPLTYNVSIAWMCAAVFTKSTESYQTGKNFEPGQKRKIFVTALKGEAAGATIQKVSVR